MKLLFDQNLSYKLVSALEEEFPGSAHVREVGLSSSDDLAVWEYAKEFGFTIVSKDTDFSQRSFLFGFPPKLIWLKLGNCSTKRIEKVLRLYRSEIQIFELAQDSSFLVIDLSLEATLAADLAPKQSTKTPVDSSVISSFKYHPESQILEIEFRASGEMYRYFEVPPSVHQEFLNAPSKGKYFNSEIKDKYRFQKIS